MMTPFLSRYMQQWHFEKQYWLTKAERRKAWIMALGILACIAITLFLWLR